MKKRSYRAQEVNEVRWEEVADRVKDKAVVLAVDVAPHSYSERSAPVSCPKACPAARAARPVPP